MRSRIVGLLALTGLAGLSACILSPPDGTVVSSPYKRITVGGFSAIPGATVTIEAWNYRKGAFEALTTAKALQDPSMIPGSDVKLYSWWTAVRIANPDEPSTLCRWSQSCAVPLGNATTRIRATGKTYAGATAATPLFTLGIGGPVCVYQKLQDGQIDLVSAYVLCMPVDFLEITVLLKGSLYPPVFRDTAAAGPES